MKATTKAGNGTLFDANPYYQWQRSPSFLRVEQVVDFLQTHGPQTIDDICAHFNWSRTQFREDRHSLPGKMAMEILDVMIPRPIAKEGWVYKVGDGYRTGTNNDVEPNLQMTLKVAVGHVASAVSYFSKALEMTPTNRKGLRKLLKSTIILGRAGLEAGSNALEQAGTTPSQWARHVRDMA